VMPKSTHSPARALAGHHPTPASMTRLFTTTLPTLLPGTARARTTNLSRTTSRHTE
jgi:hypothetical protein